MISVKSQTENDTRSQIAQTDAIDSMNKGSQTKDLVELSLLAQVRRENE